MALIKCPECGKEISDQADSCPNCGYSFEEKKRKKSKVTSGRDKTSTGLILHSVAAVAWVVFFTYMFLILGGIHVYATKDTYQTTHVNPFTWESRQVYDRDSKFIDMDQVNKFKNAGYKISYILGDDEDWHLTSPVTNFYGAMCGIVLSCFLGFVLYKMKSKNRARFFLSFIYLGITIISMVVYMRATMEICFQTAGFLNITLIPFILQIVAAVKYISGARLQSVDVSE